MHKGHSYPGEHTASVDRPLWDSVQAMLAENRVARATGVCTKQPSLLTGILFDEAGGRLTPTYCVKKGTRYRYYVSTRLVTGTPKDGSSRYRIPAGDLEAVVIERVRAFLANPADSLEAMGHDPARRAPPQHLLERGRQIADEIGTEALEKTRTIVTALVRRVHVKHDCVEIDIWRHHLSTFLAGQPIDLPMRDDKAPTSSDDVYTLPARARLGRVGREINLLVAGDNDQAAADPSLLRVVARAHDILARLAQDTKLSVHDVARQERVTAAYIYTLLRLPWLAPDITTAIVNGRQPLNLNAKKLMRLTARLPSDWVEQRTLLSVKLENSALELTRIRPCAGKIRLPQRAKPSTTKRPWRDFFDFRAAENAHFRLWSDRSARRCGKCAQNGAENVFCEITKIITISIT
jgi:site-specific DNA recombinase